MITNLEELTLKNNNYREVLNTTTLQQLVIMSIPYKEEIGVEVHPTTTQFIKIENGDGIVILNNDVYKITTGTAIVIPPGVTHNVVSFAKNGLKLYTIYSPPEHKHGLIQKTKQIK